MSAVVLSLPPIMTISSVLANGAATSAAIWKNFDWRQSFDKCLQSISPSVMIPAPCSWWLRLHTACRHLPSFSFVRLQLYRPIEGDKRFIYKWTFWITEQAQTYQFNGQSFSATNLLYSFSFRTSGLQSLRSFTFSNRLNSVTFSLCRQLHRRRQLAFLSHNFLRFNFNQFFTLDDIDLDFFVTNSLTDFSRLQLVGQGWFSFLLIKSMEIGIESILKNWWKEFTAVLTSWSKFAFCSLNILELSSILVSVEYFTSIAVLSHSASRIPASLLLKWNRKFSCTTSGFSSHSSLTCLLQPHRSQHHA